MKKAVSLLVIMVLFFSMITSVAIAEDPITDLTSQGILVGDANGNLNLDGTITRAELAKMLVTALGLSVSKPVPFADIGSNHWSWEYVKKAYAAGVVAGFEDNTFRPDEPVTGDQAVTMVLRAYGERPLAYPTGYMVTAAEKGYLEHTNLLIDQPATRRDVAQLIWNAMQIAGKEETMQPEPTAPPTGYIASYSQSGSSIGSGGGSGSTALPPPYPQESFSNTEEYAGVEENIFKNAATSPLSTFSIDVDTASYSNMRRYLKRGELPPAGAIRTEELINYFDYTYPQPQEGEAFSVTTEVAQCPWNTDNRLAMVALKGAELQQRAPSNLVFLIDVSGSMNSPEKMPLVKHSLSLLAEQLTEQDRISIVTYANSAQTVLDSVPGNSYETIMKTIRNLAPGGGTAGGAGLSLAYDCALKNKVEGNNRVILCSDGDFNIGMSSTASLEEFITEKRKEGIYLSVMGFGMGNYKDNRMETLADKGNGNYAYIDNKKEAEKVMVYDLTKTLYTIAEDVKIQVEFNPGRVREYRLVGYENRKLENEDFANDKKDAGELGAGHTVTAFYELVMEDGEPAGSELKYQDTTINPSGDLMNVKLRYREPGGEESRLIERAVTGFTAAPSENFVFASSVAQFGMLLCDSPYCNQASYDSVLEAAKTALGEDRFGLRVEFLQLVDCARYLKKSKLGE